MFPAHAGGTLQHHDGATGEECARRGGQDVTRDDTEIVSALREAIADRMGNDRFALWFGPSTRLERDGATVRIGTPNPLFRDWLRTSFRRQIEEASEAVLGVPAVLEFVVDPAGPELNRDADPPPAQPVDPPPLAPAHRSDRVERASFESFVVGPSNQLARTSAEMVVRQPGEYSPLLLHGPTGVGKTHLLESIHGAARRRGLGSVSVYLTAEQFTTHFVQALRGGGLPSFRQKHRGVELLIIDDLQFFFGKRSTLVELLSTVDTLLRERRQLVFAADRPLAELGELGAELVSRLQGGIQCALGRPEHATRLGIVERLVRQRRLDVPADVRQFIAARLTAHARELSGALCRLQAASQAWRRPITLALAEESLAEMIRHSRRVIRLPDIQQAVCQAFGLEPESLLGDAKGRQTSHPRMLAMWLARKHTRAALSEIGRFFGRRSHSTVVSAQKRVDAWISAGAQVELADRVSTVDEALRQVEQTLLAG